MSAVWVAHTPGGHREHLVLTDQARPINRRFVAMCGRAGVKVIRERNDYDVLGVNTQLCRPCVVELDLDEKSHWNTWPTSMIERTDGYLTS